MQKVKKTISLLALFVFLICSANAQNIKEKILTASNAESVQLNAGVKSSIITSSLSHKIIHENASTTKWAINVKPAFSRKHYLEEVALKKASKLNSKIASQTANEEAISSRVIAPVIGVNFGSSGMVNGTPPDNTLAISNEGIIVSANNDGIEYYNQQGQFLYFDYWSDFFNDPTLTSSIYDPKVIYDSGSDRFVLVVLHGTTASTSRVLVCFSQSSNPLNGWWVYKLTGNPLNNNCWFDYPALGVSNNEIYVTGNLFVTNGSFNQAVIYQIPKSAGYAGNQLNWQYWSSLNSSPFDAFTLFPASYGHQGNYGPGIYLISNESGGDNRVRLWDITDDMSGNPQLNNYTVNIGSYEIGADALQAGNNDKLDVGDCRVQNAFYLNGILHYAFTADIGNGWNGLHYNRLTVSSLSNQSSTFGLQGSYDYCYPAVAPYSTSVTDKSVMIAFLRSSSSTFPEVSVVNCDNNMQWSSSTQVKSGETFVNIVSGDERWGDYNGISRKHNSPDARVWLSGSYGANIPSLNTYNTYRTWIAEVAETPAGLPPTTNFSANPTSGNASLTVNFTDLSTNSPTAWSWSFPGGNPSASSQQNPTVTYLNPGVYSVSLTSSNVYGSNINVKNNYINVAQAGQPPIANFSADPTSGFQPLTVSFTDLSSNNPTSRTWNFSGGNPPTSNDVNPVVTYNSAGIYDVSLTVTNSFGSNTETKPNYINVELPTNLVEVDNTSEIKVYPNPTYDILNIRFRSEESSIVQIKIIDINGKVVRELYNDIPKNGLNTLSFNRSALPTGTYFVNIQTENKIIKNEKIIVVN